MVMVLDGPFLAPLSCFFVPEVGMDFTEETGAVFLMDPDRAAPNEHRSCGDALPDSVSGIPDSESPFAQLRF